MRGKEGSEREEERQKSVWEREKETEPGASSAEDDKQSQSLNPRAEISELEQGFWLCNKPFNGQTASPFLPQGNTKSLFIVVCTDVSELSISLITLDAGTSISRWKITLRLFSHKHPAIPLSPFNVGSESYKGQLHQYK